MGEWGFFGGRGFFFGWGPYPILFCTNLLVKLGYPPNFNFLGKPLLGEKYVEGKKKKEEERRIMPSLLATMCVCTHYVRTNTLLLDIVGSVI